MDVKNNAPKNRHNLESLVDELQPSVGNKNKIQVDCDNFVSASDAYIKKRVIKRKGFGGPVRVGYRAKLGGPKLVRKNLNNVRKAKLPQRDWKQISVHPFINFLRIYRKKFARNTPNEEIARRGRNEWRKMSCKSKEKYYEQAQRARMRGFKV